MCVQIIWEYPYPDNDFLICFYAIILQLFFSLTNLDFKVILFHCISVVPVMPDWGDNRRPLIN